MTSPSTLTTTGQAAPPARYEIAELRAGSRAARLAHPRTIDALKALAAEHGVCVRPLALRRTDLTTGQTELIDLPCGATLEAKCPSCAARARRMRQRQIREGWHRTDEPTPPPPAATEGQKALLSLRAHLEFARAEAERAAEWHQINEIDTAIAEIEQAISAEGLRGTVTSHTGITGSGDTANPARRVRSTRRRSDVADLPRQKIEPRTLGRTYVAADGTEHRPSMWLTLTLDSYGSVHSIFPSRPCTCRRWHRDDDPQLGTPLDAARYDYRRAAWDAVHFPRLLDRFWQNLRRAAGWNVQYAGCVEPQRRLAPHAHFAIRGTIPRTLLQQVAAATYHHVWWPPVSEPVYSTDRLPVWNPDLEGWVDPDTRQPLQTWDEALDALDADPETEPAHMVRFGPQVKAKGVEPGSRDIGRTVSYITKYLTKQAADCHQTAGQPQRDHHDRLWAELRITPCTARCANWLLYGIAPKAAHSRLRPGACKGKVHQKATLGIGGRRVLVSRDWSGKTLADHRYDTRSWVRTLLGTTSGGGDTQHDESSQGPTVAWELARWDDPDLPLLQHRLLRLISQRIQHRAAIRAAQQRDGPNPADVSSAAHEAQPRPEPLIYPGKGA